MSDLVQTINVLKEANVVIYNQVGFATTLIPSCSVLDKEPYYLSKEGAFFIPKAFKEAPYSTTLKLREGIYQVKMTALFIRRDPVNQVDVVAEKRAVTFLLDADHFHYAVSFDEPLPVVPHLDNSVQEDSLSLLANLYRCALSVDPNDDLKAKAKRVISFFQASSFATDAFNLDESSYNLSEHFSLPNSENYKLSASFGAGYSISQLLQTDEPGLFLEALMVKARSFWTPTVDSSLYIRAYPLAPEKLNRLAGVVKTLEWVPDLNKLFKQGESFLHYPTESLCEHLYLASAYKGDWPISRIIPKAVALCDYPVLYEAFEFFLVRLGNSELTIRLFEAFVKENINTLDQYGTFVFKEGLLNQSLKHLENCLRERFADKPYGFTAKDKEKIPYVMPLLDENPLMVLTLLASNQGLTKKQKEALAHLIS